MIKNVSYCSIHTVLIHPKVSAYSVHCVLRALITVVRGLKVVIRSDRLFDLNLAFSMGLIYDSITSELIFKLFPNSLVLLAVLICVLFIARSVYAPNTCLYPPGPWGLPVIGNLLQLGSAPHLNLHELSRLYGEVLSLRLGSRRVVVLSSVRVLREALAQKARHFSDRPPLFTTQLCGSREKTVTFGEYGPLQVRRKKCAMRALHQSVFANMQHLDQLVADETRLLLNKLCCNLGEAVDPCAFLRTAVINLTFRLNFGDDDHNEKMQKELEHILDQANDFVENSAVGGLLDFMPWLVPLFRKEASKMEHSVSELFDFVRKVYTMRKEEYDGNSSCLAVTIAKIAREMKIHNNESEPQLSPIDDVFDDADPNGSFSQEDCDESVKNLLVDVFGAGLETVSTAFCWSVLYLATDAKLQQDLQQEIDRVVGPDRFPTIADKPSMPLLQATVLEILRISTIVPFSLPHWTTEDTSVDGYTVPKETVILVNLWAVNHDPRHFQQPDRFNPRRFLDENGQLGEDRYAFAMPFSTGRRRCAGSTLAKAELFLFLAGLLQRCGFEAGEIPADLRGQFGLTLRPPPFTICVHPRDTGARNSLQHQ